MNDAPAVQLKVISSLAAVAAEDWDACANPDSQVYNPFLRHGAKTGYKLGCPDWHTRPSLLPPRQRGLKSP